MLLHRAALFYCFKNVSIKLKVNLRISVSNHKIIKLKDNAYGP